MHTNLIILFKLALYCSAGYMPNTRVIIIRKLEMVDQFKESMAI